MDGLSNIKWGPVIDKVFLYHPDDFMLLAPRKKSIIGFTNKEAALFTIMGVAPFLHKFGINPSNYPEWTREKFISTIKKYVDLVYTGDDAQKIVDDLVSFYVDRGEEKNYEFYIDRYTQFISDAIFNVPIVDGILSRRKAGWTIYAYFLDHYNDAIWNDRVPKRLRGISLHAS
ncbi:unnamed protein product [Cylicostephanus goldi]|uniref:Carboxylesterase type B domain-containing protein n=1 Tax=Cylicostephanus goldi TaxID=71465 RepID=A0A3P7N6Y8_CYLGO|nr:unnamed protein product [Cylicostephanus goldi]